MVCGGRRFADVTFVWNWLDGFHAETPISALITGGSTGVDNIASQWAATKLPPIERYVSKPKWAELGRAAGPVRNKRMLEWKPDVVIAFPGSAGTADMVMRAKVAKIRVIEVCR